MHQRRDDTGRPRHGRRTFSATAGRAAVGLALLTAAAGCSEEPTNPGSTTGGAGGAGGAGGDGGLGGVGGQRVDGDGDGYFGDTDCNDEDPYVHPAAIELCDGIDNNCDDEIDGPDSLNAVTWYRDQDGDGWGVVDQVIQACEQPDGWVLEIGDCDDEVDTVYPGAPELCDLLDNDCDGFGDVPGAGVISPPWGPYYVMADASSGTSLRPSLHEIIHDHQFVPYTSTATDTWDILEAADEHPGDSAVILDIYRNAAYPKHGGGNMDYDREHVWPQSYLPDDADRYPHTDCHHLFLADFGYNASRGNLPFDVCGASCNERPTELNANQGGGTGVYPGNSNWRKTGTWETWIKRRGDVARALFYMDVRYEGGTHGGTAHLEPDLILTDDPNLIVTTAATDTVAYMGILSTLLVWHCEDPVSPQEIRHHETVYAHQGNRNPFVDHPEWAYCLFLDQCGP